MVSARLFNSFGLCLFNKGRVVETPGKRCRFLGGRLNRLGDPRAFGIQINDASQRQDKGRLINDQLHSPAFWRGGLSLIEGFIDELETLT